MVIAAAFVWGRSGADPGRDHAAPVRAARVADGGLGAVVDLARADLHRGGAHVLLPRGVRRGRRGERGSCRGRRRAARGAHDRRGGAGGLTRSPRACGPRRSPRTRSRTGSASRSTTGTPSAAWPRWRCRSRCGSARARRQPHGAGARLSRHGRLHPRDPADPVARRRRGRPGGRARLVRPRAAAPPEPAGAARAAGAASAVGAWALSKDPFTKSLQPLSAKESVAGDFGGLVS